LGFSPKDEDSEMLKPKSEKVANAVEAILQAASEYNRGDVITHDTLEAVGGIERGGTHWGTIIVKVKRRLQNERGITLWSVPSVGYRLCTAREQINECVDRRSKRALRQLNKGAGHLEAVPAEELTPHDQIVRAKRMDAQRLTMQRLRQQRKISSIFSRQPNGGDQAAQ
jgi:hypothetical protein